MIGGIVTRGFGTFSDVNKVVTRGYYSLAGANIIKRICFQGITRERISFDSFTRERLAIAAKLISCDDD